MIGIMYEHQSSKVHMK